MAGPTQGLIEFPLSTREANMEMRGLIRAYDELAKAAEKHYAKAGRAEAERAVAAEAYHKALENKAQIAKNLGDKEKQQAEQLIPLILQKKQQILDEVAAHKEKLKILREIEQVNERRAGHVAKALSVNATDIAMTEGQIAGYEGQMSASPAARTAEENRALRERIELKKQEFITRRQAAEEENEAFGAEVARLHAKTRMQQEYNEEVGKARLRIITPEEIEADTRRAARQIKERNEALAAQVSGPASLSMDERGLAIKRQLAEVENYYQGAIEGRAKAAINAAKIEAEAADIAKLAATAKDPLIEKEAAYHVELARVSREIEVVRQRMQDLAKSDVGSASERTQAMHALAQRLVPLQKEQKEYNRLIESGTGGIAGNRMALQQLAYGMQDFISAGGLHNFAMGLRGSTNNLEMLMMATGKAMSPLKMLGISLLPTVAYAAIDMATNMHKASAATDEAAESAKKYADALHAISSANRTLTQTELEKQEVEAQKKYAEARELARKEVAEYQKDIHIYEQRMKMKDEPGIGQDDSVRWRLIADAEDRIRRFAVAREHLAQVEKEESQRKSRARGELAVRAAGGKDALVTNFGQMVARGVPVATVRAAIRKSFDGQDPDVAEEQTQHIMDAVMIEADKVRREGKNPIKQQEHRVKRLRDDLDQAKNEHRGVAAEDEIKTRLEQNERILHQMQESRDSMMMLIHNVLTILSQINDNVRGTPAAPFNDVIRNNANAIANPIGALARGMGVL